jgi:hypothetical protein
MAISFAYQKDWLALRDPQAAQENNPSTDPGIETSERNVPAAEKIESEGGANQ